MDCKPHILNKIRITEFKDYKVFAKELELNIKLIVGSNEKVGNPYS